MPEQYSHRNGETEPPTVEEGYFWFKPPDDDIAQPQGVILIYAGACYEDGKMWIVDELTGQWWGPIVPPWEQSNA